MSDDDDDEKQEYTVGYAQMEHLGPKQRTGMEGVALAIKNGQSMANALHGVKFRMDPTDRFKVLCSIYYDKFGGDKSYTMTWDKIIAKIELMSSVAQRSKNPVAYVLGARIIGKNGIEIRRLNDTYDLFKDILNDEGIIKEDIVRYARYLLLKN